MPEAPPFPLPLWQPQLSVTLPHVPTPALAMNHCSSKFLSPCPQVGAEQPVLIAATGCTRAPSLVHFPHWLSPIFLIQLLSERPRHKEQKSWTPPPVLHFSSQNFPCPCPVFSLLSELPETERVVSLLGIIHLRIVPSAYSARDRAEKQSILLAEQLLHEAWLLSNTNVHITHVKIRVRVKGTQPQSDGQAVPTCSECTQYGLSRCHRARGAKPLRLTLFLLCVTDREWGWNWITGIKRSKRFPHFYAKWRAVWLRNLSYKELVIVDALLARTFWGKKE